jgi:hypothetical protein
VVPHREWGLIPKADGGSGGAKIHVGTKLKGEPAGDTSGEDELDATHAAHVGHGGHARMPWTIRNS